MTDVADTAERAVTPPSAARAWLTIALTPVGLLLSIAVGYGIAAILGVTLDPATGPGPSTGENLVIWGIAGLFWLAPPALGIRLAVGPARAGSRSGLAASIVGGILLVAGLGLLVVSIVNG